MRGSVQSRQIIRHPRTGDAGLRGTRTDCPRQNFLNYPAASRNNSSDSNSRGLRSRSNISATNKPGQDGGRDGVGGNVRGSGGGVFTKRTSASSKTRFLKVRFHPKPHCDSFRPFLQTFPTMKITQKFDQSLETARSNLVSPRIEGRWGIKGEDNANSSGKILQHYHIDALELD